MKRIGVDVSKEQHMKIKIACAQEGISIKDFCIQVIMKKVDELCLLKNKSK